MVWLIFLGLIAFVVVFAKLALAYGTEIASRMVNRRFDDAQWVLDTGLVPQRWTSRPRERFYLAWNRVRIGFRPEKSDEETKLYYVIRAELLARYLAKCPFFEGDDDRDFAVDRIRTIRRAWVTTPIDEILPP